MAQYFIRFTEDNFAAFFADHFSVVWGGSFGPLSWDATDQGVAFPSTSYVLYAFTGLLPASDTVETALLQNVNFNNFRHFGPAALVDPSLTADDSYCAWGQSSTDLRAGFTVAGTAPTLLANITVSRVHPSWVVVRGDQAGLKAKTYTEGDPDPGWSIEVASTQVQRSGLAGVYGRNMTAAYNPRLFAVGIGTDGDPAPTGPVGGTIPTLSAPGVTELGSTSVRPQITLTF
jgi:hypothetical protein